MTPLPPWFSKNREKINRRSRSQERRYAEENRGRVQAGSGSSWRAPQDVKEDDYLTQLKFTDKQSFSIKVAEWKKIRKDAREAGRDPKLVIDFEKEGIRLIVTEED